MMCSDVISFHNYDSAKQFYTSTSRLLESTTDFKRGGTIAIISHGREVKLRISHISVDTKDIQRTLFTEEFRMAKERMKAQLQDIHGKYILCSTDRLHPFSGVRQKLQAYMAFLDQFPRYRTKVCLVQYLYLQNEFKENRIKPFS